MHSPSEPRNPLEVVEEALAAVQDHELFNDTVTVGHDDFEPYCTHCGGTDDGRDGLPVHASNCPSSIARAALALVRKMRADAVVGSHDALVEALRRIAELASDHDFGSAPAILDEVEEVAAAALASLTDEEPADG